MALLLGPCGWLGEASPLLEGKDGYTFLPDEVSELRKKGIKREQ